MPQSVFNHVRYPAYVPNKRAEAAEGQRRLPRGRVSEAQQSASRSPTGAPVPRGDVAEYWLQVPVPVQQRTVGRQQREILLEKLQQPLLPRPFPRAVVIEQVHGALARSARKPLPDELPSALYP